MNISNFGERILEKYQDTENEHGLADLVLESSEDIYFNPQFKTKRFDFQGEIYPLDRFSSIVWIDIFSELIAEKFGLRLFYMDFLGIVYSFDNVSDTDVEDVYEIVNSMNNVYLDFCKWFEAKGYVVFPEDWRRKDYGNKEKRINFIKTHCEDQLDGRFGSEIQKIYRNLLDEISTNWDW